MPSMRWIRAFALLTLASCARLTGVNDLEIVKSVDGGTDASSPDGGAEAGPACTSDDPGGCGRCIEQHCCTEALACADDPVCKACVADPTKCSPDAQVTAYEDCANTHCTKDCN